MYVRAFIKDAILNIYENNILKEKGVYIGRKTNNIIKQLWTFVEVNMVCCGPMEICNTAQGEAEVNISFFS